MRDDLYPFNDFGPELFFWEDSPISLEIEPDITWKDIAERMRGGIFSMRTSCTLSFLMSIYDVTVRGEGHKKAIQKFWEVA